jgi:SAM-dependent methyltransferase
MIKQIRDIVDRSPEPEPWSEGDNIPWDDPEFSERMLAEHLSQDHDLASRRSETIDRHVEWIFTEILGSKPARVLDLGCGPGFYALRLARLGCECIGIDFSPASIRHARETAAEEANVSCTYRQADVRDGDFGEGFDLVTMVFGQFNVFPRDRGMEILKNAHSALKPGGALLLEYHSLELIRQEGSKPPSWYTAHSGLFSESPHLVLQENFWHDEARASTTRFCVVDADSGAVTGYALSNEAYTDAELGDALGSAGFNDVETHPSLTGTKRNGDLDFPVMVARR